MKVDTSALRRGYASTPSGQIHYAEMGEGPPLILLSESPRTHRQYRKAMPLFAKHFRAIALDTPGYGNSHPAAQPVTIPRIATDVADFLDSMSIERAWIFGLHTGNKIAAALAADRPERIERMVLAGYTHSIIPDRSARNAAILPIFERYTQRFSPSADGAHLAREWIATQSYANGLWWSQRLLTAGTLNEDDIAEAEAQVVDYLLGWRNVVAMYRAVFDFDLEGAYRRIEASTLVLELTTPQEEHLGPQAAAVAALMKRGSSAALRVSYPTALQTHVEAIVDRALAFLRA